MHLNLRNCSHRVCQEDEQNSRDGEFSVNRNEHSFFRSWTNIENQVNRHFLKPLYNLSATSSKPVPNTKLLLIIHNKVNDSSVTIFKYKLLQNQNRFYTLQVNVDILFLKVWKIMKTTNEIKTRDTKKIKRNKKVSITTTEQNRTKSWLKTFQTKLESLLFVMNGFKKQLKSCNIVSVNLSVNFWFKIPTDKFRSNEVLLNQEIPTSKKNKN